MIQRIYMDYAATTPVKEAVFAEMLPYFMESYANPAAVHLFGQEAKSAVEKARTRVAELIGANAEEIYFTSGGTEADNWALRGVAEAYRDKGKHIITSRIEHHAVLHTLQYLEKQGYDVTYLEVDTEGRIRIEDLIRAIREDTILISIMAANNEIGTLEPLAEIGRIAKERGILFHTDAVQAYGHIPLNVHAMQIDLLSASAHKCGGPKGIGLLYMRKGVRIEPLMYGGAQERNYRAGTHNTPGIVGFGKASQLAKEKLTSQMTYVSKLREYMVGRVTTEIPFSFLNGGKAERLAGNVNICFPYVESESLLILLDQQGICASAGAACASGSMKPSHVLLAIGRSTEEARSSIRFSLSEETTREEIDIVVNQLVEIVANLRSRNTAYQEFIHKNRK